MTDPTTTSETAGASAARVNRDELRKVVHNFECANLSHGGIGVLLTAARELLARDETDERRCNAPKGQGERYCDDRKSLAQEIRSTLKARGHWCPETDGADLISAVGVALDKHATASEARDEAKGEPAEAHIESVIPDRIASMFGNLRKYQDNDWTEFRVGYVRDLMEKVAELRALLATRQPVEAAQRRPATDRFQAAMDAIDLFIEYRDKHGYTEERVRGQAALDMSDPDGIAGQGEREGGD